jgi:hypothetical protein
MNDNNYKKFRGNCKQLSEEVVAIDPTMRIAKGWYHCPLWGQQGHWWCVKPDGTIYDPSVDQFPTGGAGAEYEEFDGTANCSECGKIHTVVENLTASNYSFCSSRCYARFVGIFDVI